MEKTSKTIALAWWWTWGHTFPLLWLSNYLWDDYNAIWFWEEDSLEEKTAFENSIEFKSIKAWKIRRDFSFKNAFEPLKNIVWFFQSFFYLFHYNVDIIFSKWWYVSLPVCLAWKVLWKKIFVHESDMSLGLANKIVSKFADKVFYSFDNENIDNEKHILSWQIINPELFYGITTKEIWENDRMKCLVTWWSQWSQNIFEALLDVLWNLNDIDFNIVVWTLNDNYYDKFKDFPNVKVYHTATQSEMREIYRETDISITRWWATSLWEMYFFGIHSIIVPLSSETRGDQIENADYFKDKFWSDILEDNSELSLEIFRKLSKYKALRKKGLNLDWQENALKIIKINLDNI